MKKIFYMSLLSMPLLASTSAFAQSNSGRVTYEEKITLEIKLSGDAEQFKDMIPKERKGNMELLFTPEASLYKPLEKKQEDESIEHQSGGAQMKIVMKKPENKVFADITGNKVIEQKEFMDRFFLIETDRSKNDWKLTGVQKMIMSYPCQQATKTADGKKIIAWFTPAIAVSTGPQSLGGLPGLILEADIEDGKIILTAKDIKLEAIDKGLLEKPSKGKKTTKEEFKKIVDEKTKEMQEQYGGSGNVIIKTK